MTIAIALGIPGGHFAPIVNITGGNRKNKRLFGMNRELSINGIL